MTAIHMEKVYAKFRDIRESIERLRRFAAMARFRNLLVHRYWEIDYGRMYDIITGDDLNDLERFMK